MFDAVTYVLAKNASKKYTDYVATNLEWKTEIVEEVPDPAEADSHTIYFVPADPEDPSAGYNEYIKVNDTTMEQMGSTAIMPDLHTVGFLTDANDDEMLIIDCDIKYVSIETAQDIIDYIKAYYNTPNAWDNQLVAMQDVVDYVNSLSDSQKSKCWLILWNGYARSGEYNAQYVYFVKTDGTPYMTEVNDGKVKIKSSLNGVDANFIYGNKPVSRLIEGDRVYENPGLHWSAPSSSVVPVNEVEIDRIDFSPIQQSSYILFQFTVTKRKED